MNLGTLYASMEKYYEAEKNIAKSIKLKPNYVEAFFNLGSLYHKNKKFNQAEINFNKVISLNPKYIAAYSQLGIVYQNQNKLDEAESTFKKALELNPKYFDAQKNLDILLKQKNLLKKLIKKKKTLLFDEKPFIGHKSVDDDLIKSLYNIETTKLDDVDTGHLRYGNGYASDYKLFENNNIYLKKSFQKLIKFISLTVKSEIYVMESFYNIFKAGSGIVKHNHLQIFNKNNNLENNKYSLVYYLSVGDQTGKNPGKIKLYDPEVEILPTKGMIIIFPASKMHKATYDGNTDRIMIGINFYSLE